ncbi:RNA polymerase factor sigma-54 [Metabacillus endolithicus]|uniref:RNA polymerase factor sigma-54 n=1 Tax=Metabacillus endolithicus TaxID=1535204 RepID=A0ABW5BYI7_9BACI|nr:RNA polymerase factor sigma-54 [Metabacillus endolithicus]UPG65241.1 RNA polymerase factor sigma-54 [Metabacillus endolithicus]
MRIELVQQQTLKLNMTQELQQAISLLQYSSDDLLSYVQELTMENPLIEVRENDYSPFRQKPSSSTKQSFIENTLREKTGLREHLRQQLIDFSLNKNDRACLELLIQAIDSNGYVKDSLTDLASVLGVSEELLESKLYFLQSLEPAGIGARSLQECILLQLRRLPIRNELAEIMISEHFRPFAEKSWKELSKKLNVKIGEIQEIHDLVKQLEPRPGLKYEADDCTYVKPDMTIKQINGDWRILYNDELIPQLLISEPIECSGPFSLDEEAQSYYSKKLTQGKWLQRAIEQRKETMINVMKVIIQKQQDFFIHGKSHLRPLTLKEVADILNIHESTVSRTVKDKFIQTPHGLVMMKTFFTNKVAEDNGEISSASVKMKLKKLIDSENKKKPLSDQKIANELKTLYDIGISRRTVTKYREQLNIPTSAIRKEY